MSDSPVFIRWFETLTKDDVALVGGKNSSLGELVQNLSASGVRVPPGFATTSDAYWALLDESDLRTPIEKHLNAVGDGDISATEAAREIRTLIREAPLPEALDQQLTEAYRELGRRLKRDDVSVAVRSSATAEDLPTASFAGQQESFLNVRGEDDLKAACRRCFASLFTERAISYREAHGFDHMKVALSVGIQQMVRADRASAGVMFTIDTESGFRDVALIHAAWGLGEVVVKGQVTPDQYMVYTPFVDRKGGPPILEKTCGTKRQKLVYTEEGTGSGTSSVETTPEEREAFVLTDSEIQRLARWGADIEDHYGFPMDIEWAKDGENDAIYIVQARPETVHGKAGTSTITSYQLIETGQELVKGQSVGESIASGPVRIVTDPTSSSTFPEGAVLVAENTDPDWVPIMRKASAIVTDHGGRTSHAAIVSRELGVPAVVGTRTATSVLESGQQVTVSCAGEAQGVVYDGKLAFRTEEIALADLPKTRTNIMINVASPATALRWWRLPVDGVGLARMEYIINQVIRAHPLALTRFDEIDEPDVRSEIEWLTLRHDSPEDFFVETLAQGIATIAASQYPRPVIVRLSDFKTNEYAQLVGGAPFEPKEENPMLGWRGASRYYSDAYRDGFALECQALHRVRSEMGFTNVVIMIPFCRTPEEADRVLEEMEQHGLVRGGDGLQVYVMAEIPSNVTLAESFAERFNGFSIGSNDLTQLVLGVDRDSERLAYLFDERHPAVIETIRSLIQRAHSVNCPVGICGQAPSDYPDFASMLVEAGIDSISVLPDSVVQTLKTVAEAEKKIAQPIQ
ncbi:phosphoenolpyruvate synthase [Longibacter salinarum]|uniref:Phosphoenolpyruvate synthase n=1 Tax=Longibacter salinarum TaxID=1850348 RepID=A0A2A8CX12_9BACT|nr:phosphoenolpyruvate synthase [Longibacter salinarum]PEN12928.1 phosphoenolpyruvate synthase [Longibacter salinarum]